MRAGDEQLCLLDGRYVLFELGAAALAQLLAEEPPQPRHAGRVALVTQWNDGRATRNVEATRFSASSSLPAEADTRSATSASNRTSVRGGSEPVRSYSVSSRTTCS